jgi:hypothetical protein
MPEAATHLETHMMPSSSSSLLIWGRYSVGQRRMPGTLVASSTGGSRPMAFTPGLWALSARLHRRGGEGTSCGPGGVQACMAASVQQAGKGKGGGE